MWWLLLAAGVIAVLLGLVQLACFFRHGLSDRATARSGPAVQLVRATMLVTGGLFVSFFATANLVARSVAGA